MKFNRFILKLKKILKIRKKDFNTSFAAHRNEEGFSPSQNGKNGKSDFLAKILCVFAAFILWVYVINAQSPTFEKTFTSIPITLSNVSKMKNGLSIISGYDNKVDVVLYGKKSDINKVKAEDIKAYVDLSNISEAGEYPLNISVSPPPGTTEKQITPGSLYVYVDKTITRTVPIRTEYTGGTNDNQNLIIDELVPAKEFVSVTGPEEEVLKISHGLVSLTLGIIDRSVKIREKISLVGQNGLLISNPYIKTDITEVDVSVPVYKIKNFPIVPQYKQNYYEPDVLRAEISPSTITVKGPVEVINSLNSIQTAIIDETIIDGSATLQLSLALPNNVTAYDSTSMVEAKLTIRDYVERNFIIYNENFILENAGKYTASDIKTPYITVTLAGSKRYMDTIDESMLRATVDFDALTVTGNTRVVPVTVNRPVRNVFVKAPTQGYRVEVQS